MKRLRKLIIAVLITVSQLAQGATPEAQPTRTTLEAQPMSLRFSLVTPDRVLIQRCGSSSQTCRTIGRSQGYAESEWLEIMQICQAQPVFQAASTAVDFAGAVWLGLSTGLVGLVVWTLAPKTRLAGAEFKVSASEMANASSILPRRLPNGTELYRFDPETLISLTSSVRACVDQYERILRRRTYDPRCATPLLGCAPPEA